MQKESYKRVLYAWVFLLTLMPVYVVKAFHSHEAKTIQHHDHKNDIEDDCFICHFVLFPFSEVEYITFSFLHLEEYNYLVLKIFAFYQTPHYSYGLRAPPLFF